MPLYGKPTNLNKLAKALKKYHSEIEREPYLGTFQYQDKQFTVVNFMRLPNEAGN
jgi:hypothetical protein